MSKEKECIRLVYVDDDHEPALSKYLAKYDNDKCEIIHEDDIPYNASDGYEELLNNTKIQEANIVVIDSKLFSNSDTKKVSGEEFKIILEKVYPFIEVLVITQMDIEDGFVKIKKFNPQIHKSTAKEYYCDVMKKPLDDAVERLLNYRSILKKIKDNSAIDRVLREKIENSIEGYSGSYDELTKADIDEIIKTFREVQALINEK